MRLNRGILLLILMATTVGSVAFFAPAGAQSSGVTPTDDHLFSFGDIPADFADRVTALGGEVVRTLPEIGVAVARGLSDGDAAAIAGRGSVARDLLVPWTPGVEDFDVDTPAAAGHYGGDPTTASYYPCQWNLHQIDAAGAWAQDQFGMPNVKVAVLDTGVDPLHQDLAGKIDLANSVSMLSSPSGCDTVVPDVATINDYRFHGAFVSGIISSNHIGVAGVNALTQIVGVKVLNCLGSGSFSDVIAGIIYAANLPDVDVINMSLGAYFPKNLPGAGQLVAALNRAVNYAEGRKGKLVVSAAGNNGADLDHDRNFTSVPAQSGAGIAAWAGDIDGNLAGYSNHGRATWVGAGGGDNTPGSPNVPLAGCTLPAFGHDGIVSVCSTTSLFFGCGSGANYLFNGEGTSFSAPAVSGVAALVDGKYGGGLNGDQLRTALSRSADDLGKKGTDGQFSHGRVNARRAVQ